VNQENEFAAVYCACIRSNSKQQPVKSTAREFDGETAWRRGETVKLTGKRMHINGETHSVVVVVNVAVDSRRARAAAQKEDG